MLLLLPNELQADILSFCPSDALVSLALVSHHVHAHAVAELYTRPVTVRSWTALLGLFSLAPASTYASPADAANRATGRRAELDRIRTLILDFPHSFLPTLQIRGRALPAHPGLEQICPPSSWPSFGPIPKLLALRTRPLELDTLLISHGQPFHPLGPLLQCLNPIHFGAFGSLSARLFNGESRHKLSLELDWRLYASFGRKTWSRLERWSYGPVGEYVWWGEEGTDDGIASSPFKRVQELKQATVHLPAIDRDTKDVLQTFRAFCPSLQAGKAVKVLVDDEWDRVKMEELKESVVQRSNRAETVKDWWRALEIEIGDHPRAIGGRTVWPEGLLPT